MNSNITQNNSSPSGLVEAEFAGIAGQPNLVFFFPEEDATVALNPSPMLGMIVAMPKSLNYCALFYSGKEHPKEFIAMMVAKAVKEFGLGMIATTSKRDDGSVAIHVAVEESTKIENTNTYRTHALIGIPCSEDQYEANVSLLSAMLEATRRLNPEQEVSKSIH